MWGVNTRLVLSGLKSCMGCPRENDAITHWPQLSTRATWVPSIAKNAKDAKDASFCKAETNCQSSLVVLGICDLSFSFRPWAVSYLILSCPGPQDVQPSSWGFTTRPTVGELASLLTPVVLRRLQMVIAYWEKNG